MAATHRDLAQAVAQGRFRADLYYRLNVFLLRLPPLRRRREDIPLLTDHFLGQFASQHHQDICTISPEALSLLREYDWPGNVRELEYALHRAAVLAKGGPIEPQHIVLEPDQAAPVHTDPGPLLPLAEHERRYLVRVLAHTQSAGTEGSPG